MVVQCLGTVFEELHASLFASDFEQDAVDGNPRAPISADHSQSGPRATVQARRVLFRVTEPAPQLPLRVLVQ